MVLVLFLMFWFGALTFVGVLAAPLADLFRRENDVRWWFSLPLLPALLWLAILPVVIAVENGPFGWSAIENATFTLAWFHFTLAGGLLYLGLSLAAVRGLRPGGATRRRLRTTLTATCVLVILGVQPVLWSLVDEAYGILTAWLGVGCFAGVLWVWAVNRHGPWRLTVGKRWSAAFLIGALFQLGLAASHMAFVLRQAYPGDWEDFTTESWLLVTPVLLLLPIGLRFLAGPLPTLPLLISALTAVTLVLPPALLLSWRPYDGELPRWVDLRGEPGPDLRVSRNIECIRVPGDSSPCRYSWGDVHIAASPDTPLDRLPLNPEILVEDGRRTAHGKYAYSDPHRIEEENGLARIDGGPPMPLGPELYVALQGLGQMRIPIEVQRTPHWTVQDYVSICASYPFDCELK